MKINALIISNYKDNGRSWKAPEADEKTAVLIQKLAAVLDKLEPQGDDNLHSVWIKARRPTFRQFYKYNYEYDTPYGEADQKTLTRATEEYKESYPDPSVWFKLSVKHFTRDPGVEFYGVFIDNSYVLAVNDLNGSFEEDASDLIEWAIDESEKAVAAVKNGTYGLSLKKIPYRYRTGSIRRRDLWEVDPKSKKDFFSRYKKTEIKQFYKNFKSGDPDIPLLPEMTTRIFYEACAVIYKALGRDKNAEPFRFKESENERKRYGNILLTPKELYYANADGRDDGLMNIPLDDPAAFEEWDRGEGPYYESNGTHPWEIVPSFSTSFSMHLSPWKSESGGYYFSLSGESTLRAPETVIAANALTDAGYPVEVVRKEEIFDRLEGNDYIAVIPFDQANIYEDSIQIPEGDTGRKIAAKVKWDFETYKLKSR